MHKIVIEHSCGCVRRSDLEVETTMESKDDALIKAMKMRDTMNEEFCGKHEFVITENEENFHISFAKR